jgi:hypothetical protein
MAYLDAVIRGEPVELVEQLQHGALHFAVAAQVAVEALGSDGVDLVDEDDARRLRVSGCVFGSARRTHTSPAREW